MTDFSYKGSRKYIHVTDIYNKLIQSNNYSDVVMLFKKKIINQPRLVFQNTPKKKLLNNVNCVIDIIHNNKKKSILIYDTKKKINTKYYFDDELFYGFFKIKKNSCNCNFETSMSSIEVLVAMTKYFHKKKLKNCSWIITKLKLDKKLNEKKNKNYTIYLKNYINNFTKLDVYQDKKHIGEIQFSREKYD